MTDDVVQIEDVAVSVEEAVETLRAIRAGSVDAVVVNETNGHRVLAFRDPDDAYRVLVEAMCEGAALVSQSGTIVSHNPSFAELTSGDRAASLRGRALHEVVRPDASASIATMLERARLGPARLEVGIAGPDRRTATVQLTASAPTGADAGFVCVVATGVGDQRAQADLYRAALSGMEARDRLISIAGHELRAPVQVLVSQIGILLTQDGGATQEQLESIQRLGFQVADLVANLLDIKLLGSSQLDLLPEDLDLAEVVRACVKRSEDVVRSHSTVNVEARSIRGRWDRVRLEQVVTNLLSNAGKYGLGKPIRIVVDGDDDVARLVVEDHGIGIAPEAHERLFRPFERIGSVKTATGLGLGLYITAQIVKAHGGTIRVESVLGEGSTVVVELPYGRLP